MLSIQFLDDDDNIVKVKEHALRSHLSVVLSAIGIADTNKYSFHSFRRGGAYYCGFNGVPDYIIKAHGRWKSSPYIRYVSIQMNAAGEAITNALKKFK